MTDEKRSIHDGDIETEFLETRGAARAFDDDVGDDDADAADADAIDDSDARDPGGPRGV